MQLHMVLSMAAWEKARVPGLPEGYLLRTFRDADREAWIALMRSVGFDEWGYDTLKHALSVALPEGIFFIEHSSTRELAATTMACHGATELHPFGGELGWVAVSPGHRGKRLSSIACAEVTRRFLSAGYRDIYLKTDDWRLPAIKTYLNLGYVPLLCSSDMEERWRLICRNLELRFEELGARPT